MFVLKASHLDTYCKLNEYPINRAEMVFFGLRGCLPINPEDSQFRPEQSLETATINHINPRCTLLQWLPQEGTLAVFPGSTVPHQSHIKQALPKKGAGANMLLTGFYPDYRRGTHKASSNTGHEAWQQREKRPFRRTADDLDYDTDDRVEWDNPGDNLHAAWCGGVNANQFASAGCQVVVGFPKCVKLGNKPSTGPWKAFHGNAYNRGQDRFGYVLAHGNELQRLALSGPKGMERVRFNSKGPRARQVQEALKQQGFYEGILDEAFAWRSLRALLRFQEVEFGSGGDDGICGPQTAERLAISWP